jgi:hypothetical protein
MSGAGLQSGTSASDGVALQASIAEVAASTGVSLEQAIVFRSMN